MVMRPISHKVSTVNIHNAEPTRLSPLNNGVRVASEPSPGHLASLSVAVHAGVAHERSCLNGVANLLQQAAVKSQANAVHDIGATLTGHTSRETTTYTISCLPEDTEKAVSILGNIVTGTVSQSAFEEARQEAISHRRALWDVVNEEIVMDFLYSAAYQQTPFQQSVPGEIADLKKATVEDVNAFRTTNYTGSNVVVSASGAVDSGKLTGLVEKSFNDVPEGHSRVFNSRIPFTGSFMHVRDETVDEVQVAIAYETFSYNHPHALTLDVLKELIGQWSNRSLTGTYGSPRLAEGFAQQKLVERYHTFSHYYRNTGLFGTYIVTKNLGKLDDVVYHTFNEYQKLLTYISPEELFRAKNSLKTKILFAEEQSDTRSRYVGEQVLNLDRRLSPAEAFARIDNITVSDIHEVLDHYFYDVDPAVVAHGDLDEMPDYVVMRNWTYWNRW